MIATTYVFGNNLMILLVLWYDKRLINKDVYWAFEVFIGAAIVSREIVCLLLL